MTVLSLFPSQTGKSFDADSTAAPVNGQVFALPEFPTRAGVARTVRWRTAFATAPTSVDIRLQGALNDVDAEYKDLDTSTLVAGDDKTVQNVKVRFIRARVAARVAGSGVTVEIFP